MKHSVGCAGTAEYYRSTGNAVPVQKSADSWEGCVGTAEYEFSGGCTGTMEYYRSTGEAKLVQ